MTDSQWPPTVTVHDPQERETRSRIVAFGAVCAFIAALAIVALTYVVSSSLSDSRSTRDAFAHDVQVLRTRIDAVRKENGVLKADNADLHARLDALTAQLTASGQRPIVSNPPRRTTTSTTAPPTITPTTQPPCALGLPRLPNGRCPV